MPRTDVNTHAKGMGNSPRVHPEYPAGTLVVRLLEPKTRRELYWAKADTPLLGDPADVERQMNVVVAQMFRKYPTRHD